MKIRYTLTLLVLACLSALTSSAVAQVADSVDVLHYDVSLDLSNGKPFKGDATLALRLLAPCNTLELKLYGTADSIWVDGALQSAATLASIPLSGYGAGDTATIRVKYTGNGHVESGSVPFGGFHFDYSMHYSLGTSFGENPHSIGRALYPCRDNFHDKATYTLRVRSKAGWTAECSGRLVSRETNDDDTESSVWQVEQEVSTYIVAVSQAQWQRISYELPSLYGTYPIRLSYLLYDSTKVRAAFSELDSVVPAFERCFGPYRFGSIGYIGTTLGSMEHVNNISLVRSFMISLNQDAQTTIAHELGHSWFGNLITCATEKDMWINEGGATFSSEVAMEAVDGRSASDAYYQEILEEAITSAHIADGDRYRALSPMAHTYTYGTTTYKKGALVWHSLRGVLGEERFYQAIRKLMDTKAFSTVTAYDVRDSLALYTGKDLTDFFDFHVFTPGFVDCHAELLSGDIPQVKVHLQGVGTNQIPKSMEIPIALYGADGSRRKVWLPIEGSECTVSLGEPYAATHMVLDRDMELSDAATLACISLSESHPAVPSCTHVRLNVADPCPTSDSLYVEHHWGNPFGSMPEGVVRTADRYWIVRGAKDRYDAVQGRFHYHRNTGYNTYLDGTLLPAQQSVDSVVLLYRKGDGHPWQALSHRHTSTQQEGYFEVDSLHTGEYTLAVADFATLGIDVPQQPMQRSLFPNPVHSGTPLSLQLPDSGRATVRIYDASGRCVWQKKGCHHGQKLLPRLQAGTYLVHIENKVVSLQSKLIVL